MRVGAENPARSDHASRPGPQKNLRGAAKSRPQLANTRVFPSPLRCPAYKRKRLVGGGGISAHAFLTNHLPSPPRPAAGPPPKIPAKAAGGSTPKGRHTHLLSPPPLSPSPCIGGPPDLRICGPSSPAAGFGFFRPPVAAPSDGMVGEHLPQPRQGRIAACRYGLVLPPPPTVCGHGFVRPSTGVGARAAALWLADASHKVRRLHADRAAAHIWHAGAPRKRAYSANIPFYGSVMRGLQLRPSAPARKCVFPRTANTFCGPAGCGVC
jgi:hypothetical protein